MKTGEIMFRKTFCPDKRLCFLAEKSDSKMLRGWLRGVSYMQRFATIRRYSPLFETIRTIRTIRYSRLFGIRYSLFGFSRHPAANGLVEAPLK